VTAARRGNGERETTWDELPLLEGEARAGENLPLFAPTPPAEEPGPDERHRGGRRSEGAARSTRGAEPSEPGQQRVWVQTSLEPPAPGLPGVSPADALPAADDPEPRRVTRELPRLSERLLAGFADCVVHLAVLAGGLVAESLLGLQPTLGQWPGFAVFLLCFSFLYTTVPLAFWGQTPGMAWRGLRARDGGDRQLHFGQTALRWLGALATAALLGLPLLLAIGGRSFADRLSGSETFAEVS
jgi:uncharacterized RDD family membrane protein YckC